MLTIVRTTLRDAMADVLREGVCGSERQRRDTTRPDWFEMPDQPITGDETSMGPNGRQPPDVTSVGADGCRRRPPRRPLRLGPSWAMGRELTESEKEIAAIFAEAQRSGRSPEATDVDELPARQRNYLPERFAVPSGPLQPPSEKPPVDAVYAASVLHGALTELAGGYPSLPGTVPGEQRKVVPHEIAGYSVVGHPIGGRVTHAGDYERVRRAFKALFDVPPERMWELLLERAVRQAIALRVIAPYREKLTMQPLPEPVPAFEPPTAVTVHAWVVAMSLPGSVPEFVTPKAIEVAFEQCTDGRAGGGRRRSRLTVRRWIRELKKAAAEAERRGLTKLSPQK